MSKRTSSGKRRKLELDVCTSASKKPTTKPIIRKQEQWIDAYAPALTGDLAVAKKKVQQVQEWFSNGTQKCLILHGASGTCKSAMLKVLLKDLQVVEW